MLKNKTKIIAVFLIVLMLFSLTTVLADNEETTAISEDSLTEEIEKNIQNAASTQLQEDTYKKSDVYIVDQDVTIDYIVDGNLFVCAETVTINSQIGGDAFIIAKNLIIGEEGYIFSNLFAISSSIEIKGVVYDVYSCSQDLTLSNGYVYRDLKATCGNLTINGIVGRNVFVDCSNISFNTEENTNGVIYGDLNYSSDSESDIPANAVNGNINYTETSISVEVRPISSIIASYALSLGKFIAFLAIIWAICLWLTPKFLDNTNQYVGNKTLSLLGIGLLALILIPVASIILVLLKLTSGISAVLIGLYILSLAISKSLFTITANNYVCSKLNINKNVGIFGMLILSGIVMWILTKIPYIGGVISFISIVIGLGILVCAIIPKKSSKNNVVKVSKEEK